MHIIHSSHSGKADEHVNRECAFFITNKKGNYLSLGESNFSHTQGLHFFDADEWIPIKAIDDFHLSSQMVSIKNNLHSVERHYKHGAAESFAMFNGSLYYAVSGYDGEIDVDLDIRRLYDFDDRGRIYSISREGECVVVRYDKYTDNSLSNLKETFYVVIAGVAEHCCPNQWLRRDYPYDYRRGGRSELYVYRGLRVKCHGKLEMVVSFGRDKSRVIDHALKVHENRSYFLSSMAKYCQHTYDSRDIALSIAQKSLDDLLVKVDKSGYKRVGVFAGYPWFYQFWARDELISMRAFILQENYALVKSVLMRYFGEVLEDGSIPTLVPGGGVPSIDSAGWLFRRTFELLEGLCARSELEKYLSGEELLLIKRSLEKSIQGLAHHRTIAGLVSGPSQASWMDTVKAQRSGAFIEVQALFLSMLKFHTYLAKLTKSKPLFKSIEKEYRERVRKFYFKDGKLIDTLPEDGAVRPNVFLAYYVYPELLSVSEWKSVFDNALAELWLGWGGLSSINHYHPRFKLEYTGSDDDSYHNGDSWYFVNNYAALAMHRLDKKRYAKQIRRIVHASREEMLFSGFVGCCAEVSSSKDMRSEGCLSQAWSAASLIELLRELKP